MIVSYPLDTIISNARQLSPFYRDLYAHLPERPTLEQLPVIDQKAFWTANTQRDNRLLTGPMEDGFVFKSGGTTGEPKFSVYSRTEWHAFTKGLGTGLDAGGIKAGDRVANLFYAGELYSSFVFIMYSLNYARNGCLQLPLSGAAPDDMIEHTIDDYDITIVAGTPTTLLNLAAHYIKEGHSAPKVRRLMFGGESIYPDQHDTLLEAFPHARVMSVGYASVDAGLLGYADESCGANEHRSFSDLTRFEIIDEDSGEPIEEQGREGRVVITSLTRLLMPIIRYPAGDMACWSEPAGTVNRKFRLMGRGEEGARIGPATLYVEDVRQVLHGFHERLGATDFQMIVDHVDQLDRLTLRLASNLSADEQGQIEGKLIDTLYKARPMLTDLLDGNMIHGVRIEWAPLGGLEFNARSGKLKRVIDRRYE